MKLDFPNEVRESYNSLLSEGKWPKATEPQAAFLGGCVEHGQGQRGFARHHKAHAHTNRDDIYRGWVCTRSRNPGRFVVDGKATRTLWHEVAHLISGSGHDDSWRAAMRALGQPIPRHYKKFQTKNWRARALKEA